MKPRLTNTLVFISLLFFYVTAFEPGRNISMCKFLCKQELETLAYVGEPDIFVGGALLLVLDPSSHSDKPTEKLCFQSFYNVKVLALVTLAPLFRVESFFTVFP